MTPPSTFRGEYRSHFRPNLGRGVQLAVAAVLSLIGKFLIPFSTLQYAHFSSFKKSVAVILLLGTSRSGQTLPSLKPSALLFAAGIHSKGNPPLPVSSIDADEWADEDICTDSCPHAHSGICQEGRAGPNGRGNGTGPFPVLCDLGTDCSSCGPWHYVGPRKFLEWTPVTNLREQQVKLNVRSSATPVSFWMPYTDPSLDTDVSAQMANTGLIEPGLTWIWHKLLKEGCMRVNGEGTRGLVIDVGANFGYYTLMSAAMGCRVLSFEPVPKFSNFLRYGILRNLFTRSVEVRERVVSQESGKMLTLEVPTTGIWGTAGIAGKNLDASQRAARTEKIQALSERVDDAIPPQPVLIMKIDVEGFESAVLSSAKNLLQERFIENLIMEHSPGIAEEDGDFLLAERNPGRLLGLTLGGYTIMHLNESFRVLRGFQWDAKLPALREVTATALQIDVEDVQRLKVGGLGCPLPPEIESAGLWKCPSSHFEIERSNPKGFRSTFGYNTNIWAAKTPPREVVGEPASLLPSDSAAIDAFGVIRSWTVPGNISYPYYPGHSFRICSEVDPREQARFRCPCTVPVICGALGEAVAAAAAEGRMPPLPLEGSKAVDPASYRIENW